MRQMFTLWFSCLIFFSAYSLASTSESERLKQWLDARYEEELKFSPMTLTKLGRKQQYADIDDFSEAAWQTQLQWQLATLDSLREDFDYQALDADARVSYDYWIYRAERAQAQHQWLSHHYVFDQVTGLHTAFPQFMISYHGVESEQDMLDYIARLEGIARALGQLQRRAEAAAKQNIRPPRFAFDIVLEQSRAVLSGAPFDESDEAAPWWRDAKSKIDALQSAGKIDAARAELLKQQAQEAFGKHIQPAYQQLISWLEQDRLKADQQPKGVASLSDGAAYYEYQLSSYTTTDLTAQQVHELGLAEVARIRDEMSAIIKQVEFDGSLAEFFDFVRSDEQFYYPNTEQGRQEFIDESRHYLDVIESKLPQYFGILPKADLEVRRVEAFRERDGAAAFYETGTADGSRPGVYYMHLSDMRANNRSDLQTTAYHEGSPGHHMQSSIALERDDLPLFRSNEWYSAYGEGWALYAEYLAWEMGVYDNPYYNFGRLGGEIFRAIRLVVDTGLHALGWSEEQAVQYMLDNSAIPETSVRSEIQRYLVWPGQATSYKIGMLKFLELREQASSTLGEDFDIRAFHDLVLGGGSLPLSILERRVGEWIQEQAAN
ncbi:DUF885 domain-containing protein [Parahaliea sp. F7430]|uniref:DUF885 domain-containing protein n=1 Tax=Sediminihaliea albiluteola TaxID=2758564 RepID=A0A7W2TV40_9GAMM|nr:DUF885 domain-containing protein [Sediminihaliea albiluteola]MBA6412451.1 DUF885 domain-containing protein [Sediminihaliea albiluteola]